MFARRICFFTFYVIIGITFPSLSNIAFAFVVGSTPDAYSTIGLGGLEPGDRTQIITYVPGLTLLYDLSETTIKVRRQNNPLDKRKYREATTHNGLRLLLLDEEGSLNRKVNNLEKFHFLVTRALPICRTLQSCIATDIWNQFDAGRRAGKGWYTVWARQGGKFVNYPPRSDTQFWEVKVLDNLEGWLRRHIPAKKSQRSTEDLGYITRLDRPHPLFRFEDSTNEGLSTSCSERKTDISISNLEGEVSGFVKLGAGVAVSPTISLPFANKLLKFLGLDAEVKAEASIGGELKYSFRNTNTTEISYGIDEGSWKTKTVRIERISEDNETGERKYFHYGTMLIKKVYECESLVPVKMRNANFQIFLGDVGVPVDYDDPLPQINITHAVAKEKIQISANPEFSALISISNQGDYEKAMNYLQLKKGLPRGIAAYIIKEINRSSSFD